LVTVAKSLAQRQRHVTKNKFEKAQAPSRVLGAISLKTAAATRPGRKPVDASHRRTSVGRLAPSRPLPETKSPTPLKVVIQRTITLRQ